MDFQIVQRKYIGLVNRVTQPDGNRIQFHLPVEWTFSTYHLTLPLGHLFKSQMWWKFTAQPMWDWDCPLFCKNISVSVRAENYSAGGNIDKCRWQSCAILVQNWLQQNFPVHGNQCLHRGPRMGNNFTAIRNANHSWRRGESLISSQRPNSSVKALKWHLINLLSGDPSLPSLLQRETETTNDIYLCWFGENCGHILIPAIWERLDRLDESEQPCRTSVEHFHVFQFEAWFYGLWVEGDRVWH